MASKLEVGLSDSEMAELQQFLERHDLSELLTLFLKEGVALADVFELTDEEMKELGIKTFGQRKRLLRCVFFIAKSILSIFLSQRGWCLSLSWLK